MKRLSLRFLARRKFWQRTAFTLACLVSAIVAFYQIENFRGRTTWEKYRREAIARGTKLDWRDFVPPPVPDEENFAAIPFMRQLASRDTAVRDAASKLGRLPPADSGVEDGGPADLAAENDLRRRSQRGLLDPRTGETVDFDTWRACFERSGQLATRTDNSAADVLRAMENFEPILEQFRSALPRRHNQLVTDDGQGIDANIFHLGDTLSLSQRLHFRIAALLASGRIDEAFIDWRVQYRLSEMFTG
ncbi:MAG: hypothetical protein ABIZ56_05250, partial [Chthoniobacteraceae bacterium]